MWRTCTLLAAAVIALVAATWLDTGAQDDQRYVAEEFGVSFDLPSSWTVEPGDGWLELHTPDTAGVVVLTRGLYRGWDLDTSVAIALHDLARDEGVRLLETEETAIDGRAARSLRLTGPDPGGRTDDLESEATMVAADDGTIVTLELPLDGSIDTATADELLRSLQVEPFELTVGSERFAGEDAGFVGEFWAGQHDEPAPAVLFIGGSEGWLHRHQPAQLARAGYPTLSLAYWSGRAAVDELPADLPTAIEEIPLEYFEHAIGWLGAQPEVDPERIYVWGGSRGGEGALLIGSTFPELVHGVVAVAPAHVTVAAYPRGRGAAWSFEGEPLPVASRPVSPGQGDHADPEAEIPVERIDGPVALVCGELDDEWDACPMSRRVVDRLARHGHPHPVELLAYPDVGHFLPGPTSSLTGDPRDGGDAWRDTLAFLDETS